MVHGRRHAHRASRSQLRDRSMGSSASGLLRSRTRPSIPCASPASSRCARASAHGRTCSTSTRRVPGLALPSPFLTLGQMASLHEGTYAMRDEFPLAHLNCTFADDTTLSRRYSILQERAVASRQRRSSHPSHDRSHRVRSTCCPCPWRWPPARCIIALVKAGLRTTVGLVLEAG